MTGRSLGRQNSAADQDSRLRRHFLEQVWPQLLQTDTGIGSPTDHQPQTGAELFETESAVFPPVRSFQSLCADAWQFSVRVANMILTDDSSRMQ